LNDIGLEAVASVFSVLAIMLEVGACVTRVRQDVRFPASSQIKLPGIIFESAGRDVSNDISLAAVAHLSLSEAIILGAPARVAPVRKNVSFTASSQIAMGRSTSFGPLAETSQMPHGLSPF